jgi:hypothetical protein
MPPPTGSANIWVSSRKQQQQGKQRIDGARGCKVIVRLEPVPGLKRTTIPP